MLQIFNFIKKHFLGIFIKKDYLCNLHATQDGFVFYLVTTYSKLIKSLDYIHECVEK